MKKKYYLFEDEDTGSDNSAVDEGEGGGGDLEPTQEAKLIEGFDSGMEEAKPKQQSEAPDGFDINTIAEQIANAVEFRRFIRKKGR